MYYLPDSEGSCAVVVTNRMRRNCNMCLALVLELQGMLQFWLVHMMLCWRCWR